MATALLCKQSAPGAAADAALYTVPAATSFVGSGITVCNRGAATKYRIAVAKLGVGAANDQYLCYDLDIGANAVHPSLFPGMVLNATDVVRVYNTLATCTFTLFGEETS